jgi:hypothetical protein
VADQRGDQRKVPNVRTFADSYVMKVLFATRAPRYLDVGGGRWRWLRTSLFDSYRPELHYMRGPGPKWRGKHEREATF